MFSTGIILPHALHAPRRYKNHFQVLFNRVFWKVKHLKKFSLSITLAMSAVILIAAVVTWTGALKSGGYFAKNTADKNYGKEISLRICDLALGSSQGALVPDQNIVDTDTMLSGIS